MLDVGNRENLNYFSIKDNGFKCDICGKQDKSAIHIGEGALKAIKYTILAPPKKLYSFTVKDEALREFKLMSKLYFSDHIENI